MSTAAVESSPEDLIRNIQKLMDEVEAIVARSTDDAEGAVGRRLDELEARLSNAREKMRNLYSAAREKIAAGAQQTDEAIRAHPYAALGAALGAGLLLGFCWRRRGD